MTRIVPLDFYYNSGRNWVPNSLPDRALVFSWTVEYGMNISDVLEELLGAVSLFLLKFRDEINFEHQKINISHPEESLGTVQSYRSYENDTLAVWMQIYRQGIKNDAHSLMPQGLYIKVGK
jgi:primary-amine oxidase